MATLQEIQDISGAITAQLQSNENDINQVIWNYGREFKENRNLKFK